MNFIILTDKESNFDSELSTSVQHMLDCGHTLVDELSKADMIIIAPDVRARIVAINPAHGVESYSAWKNFIYRNFLI